MEQIHVACVASVPVWFRSKERPRNGILGFDRARNETKAKIWRSLTPVPRFLLLNRTETLATQAKIHVMVIAFEYLEYKQIH